MTNIVQTAGTVAVGSSAVLGGILVLDIICGIGLLVTWYQFEREEYQNRRQRHQNPREKHHYSREKNNAPARNLGKLGSQHENLSMMAGNLNRHGINNPGIGRKLINRLAMLLNLLLKLLGLAHKPMPPNVES
jgi:hypothetical protein